MHWKMMNGWNPMNSLNFRQGEIVIAEIPYSDYSENKRRPVLITSCDIYNKNSDDVIVAKVTSNLKERPFNVNIVQKDLEIGELRSESCIKADSIIVIEKRLLHKPIAKVKLDVIESVKAKLKLIFSL